MTGPLLEVTDLTVAYGAVVAVRGVSLTVAPGETLAILGANGAGKTSLLRAITGLEPVRSGTVRLDGQDVTGARPHRIARQRVAHVPDNRGLFPTLTVAENLRMGLYGAGRETAGDAAREEVFDLFPILRERVDQPAGTMSGGQQQMLTIARALVQDPQLLLIDEMSMGLAPAIVDELFAIIRRLKERGIAVVLVEQFVGQALGVADSVVVLEQGRVVASGTPAELAGNDLAAAYLGGHDDLSLADVPPAPPRVTQTMPVSLSPTQVRALDREAAARGVPVETLVTAAVDRLLAEEGDA